MPRVTVQVNVLSCEQKQEGMRAGTDGDFMESLVHVEISVDGRPQGTFAVPLKQTQGDTFEGSSGNRSIEVGNPGGYRGPYDHSAFSAGIGEYYREFIAGIPGSKSAIVAGPKASGGFWNNEISQPWSFMFQADASTAGGKAG